MENTCHIVKLLEIVSHRINVALEHADPDHYIEAWALKDLVYKARSSYATLAGWNVLIYKGREILYNQMSSRHTNSQDPHLGWAVLTTFGFHKGGHLYLPHLGLPVRLEPGDVVVLRGCVVPHEIEEWVGQRISIPHFTHSSMWRAFKNYSVFID